MPAPNSRGWHLPKSMMAARPVVPSARKPVATMTTAMTISEREPDEAEYAERREPAVLSKPSNRWPTRSGSPRASAWQPSIAPPANTGVSTGGRGCRRPES